MGPGILEVLSSGWQAAALEEGVGASVTTGAGVDFDEFFRSEQAALLRYCWGLTTDREAARDVAQETMARAWRDWPQLQGTRPAAWIRTVALNLVRSDWRRGDRSAVVPRRAAHVDAPIDPDLVAALRALPERQREAVVLHHLGDLRVEDCASAMGLAAPTVKVHLQRGRARLAELLADEQTSEVSND
jgi:RNA polymerase sigma-70 factor (ECF subfamily)